MTRKLLGLTFLGETRHEHLILADIRLEVKHLDRNVSICFPLLLPCVRGNTRNQLTSLLSTALALLR